MYCVTLALGQMYESSVAEEGLFFVVSHRPKLVQTQTLKQYREVEDDGAQRARQPRQMIHHEFLIALSGFPRTHQNRKSVGKVGNDGEEKGDWLHSVRLAAFEVHHDLRQSRSEVENGRHQSHHVSRRLRAVPKCTWRHLTTDGARHAIQTDDAGGGYEIGSSTATTAVGAIFDKVVIVLDYDGDIHCDVINGSHRLDRKLMC